MTAVDYLTPEEVVLIQEQGLYDYTLENPELLTSLPTQTRQETNKKSPCGCGGSCGGHKAADMVRMIKIESVFTTVFVAMLFIAMIAIIVKSFRVIIGN